MQLFQYEECIFFCTCAESNASYLDSMSSFIDSISHLPPINMSSFCYKMGFLNLCQIVMSFSQKLSLLRRSFEDLVMLVPESHFADTDLAELLGSEKAAQTVSCVLVSELFFNPFWFFRQNLTM